MPLRGVSTQGEIWTQSEEISRRACPETQRPTPMRPPLSRTRLTHIVCLTAANSSIFFTSFRLRPLCRRQKTQPLCNQANSASSCKTPGVGYPPLPDCGLLLAISRASKAQKRAPVSPLPATLTHSLFCNPFVCHSYANTPDDGAEPHKNLKLHLKSDSQKWLSHFASWDIIARLIPHQETS